MAKLGFGPGETDAASFDLAEPTFPVGLGDPVEQVVADLAPASRSSATASS
ncbi:hypothetical protein ACFTWD_05005 [Streptomyces sp. NPDC056943]|uniref:hypothetical protein n=1 Tax=Streptomyces sp. NPDC056943 TaxID=3345971 RepID=UPI0036450FD2